jgi:cytochrome d ubiquinol oxidase subunit II
MSLETFFALVMLAALVAYALLGCADFGGGIWDLFSVGPRAGEQRRRIAQAIGPVWEANHVWLIFLIVVLFTCFPRAYAVASIALFWPLHLVLAGIVLRGAAFVFRAYHAASAGAELGWSRLFGIASALTPVLLGACLGAVSTGDVALVNGIPAESSSAVWLGRFPMATGLLAFLLSAYLAAVYLAWESDGDLQEDFRRRALVTWLLAGVTSFGLLILTAIDAPHLWSGLIGGPASVLVAVGSMLAPASAAALWKRRFTLARVLAGGQVALLLIGWAAAQYPYLIAPGVTIANSAAPRATLAFTAMTLPPGVALLAPSIWYLFAVFKGRNPAYAVRSRDSR